MLGINLAASYAWHSLAKGGAIHVKFEVYNSRNNSGSRDVLRQLINLI